MARTGPDLGAALSRTTRFCAKSLWYATVTVTCPIWVPILGGCYAWDVHRNGSRHRFSPARWRSRQTQQHKRNRKCRARPLLVGKDAVGTAEAACADAGTSRQEQSALMARLPTEVRSLVWDAVFSDVDVHARIQGAPRGCGAGPGAVADGEEPQQLMLFPCLDHAAVAHPYGIDGTFSQRYDTADRSQGQLAQDRSIYDLNCWPRRGVDAKLAWPKAKRKEVKRLANVLAVVRTCRLVQGEALRALARTANVASTWHWPNPVGLEKCLGEFLPFRNQRTVCSVLYTKQRYETRSIEARPRTEILATGTLPEKALDESGRHGLNAMYGPFLKDCRRLKLIVVDFRWECDERREEVWEDWRKWLVETMDELRNSVQALDIVVTDVRQEWLEGLPVPLGCSLTALER